MLGSAQAGFGESEMINEVQSPDHCFRSYRRETTLIMTTMRRTKLTRTVSGQGLRHRAGRFVHMTLGSRNGPDPAAGGAAPTGWLAASERVCHCHTGGATHQSIRYLVYGLKLMHSMEHMHTQVGTLCIVYSGYRWHYRCRLPCEHNVYKPSQDYQESRPWPIGP